MKKIFRYILLINLICSFSSCDILEVKPMEFTAPDNFYNSEDELTSGLYGVYFYMNNTYIGEYHNIILGDLGTDVTYSRAGEFVPVFQNYDMENPTIEFSDAWQIHYTAIGAANQLISRAKKSAVEGAYKEQIIAEAKVLRAYFYHNLVLLWGDVPMWTDEFDINTTPHLPRTPKASVIAQIYDDLETAIPNLPDSYAENQKGRITSWAAKAFFARVSLLQSDYETAYDQAKDVIDNSPHKLLTNFADVFNWQNKFNDELIFVTPRMRDGVSSVMHTRVSPQANKESAQFDALFAKGLTATRPDGKQVSTSAELFQGTAVFVAFNNYVKSFTKNDTRVNMVSWSSLKTSDGKTVNLKGIGKSKNYILKWAAFDEPNNNSGRDTHHIRLAEMYLILAEAANELEEPEEAVAALNKLRERAFGNSDYNYLYNVDATKTYNLADKEAIKEAIINENKWELGAEGLRRWYLIHWGYEYLRRAIEQLGENVKGLNALKEHHVLFKIPAQEFVKNPNLGSNNPGY